MANMGMGTLEVIFDIGLAYPVILPEGLPDLQVLIAFSDSGNTVKIDPPVRGPQMCSPLLGSLDKLMLRVHRACTQQEGKAVSWEQYRRMRIPQDAARAFFRLFETLRQIEYGNNTLHGYPVVPSEELSRNPLVKMCEYTAIYEGIEVGKASLTGAPTISFSYNSWEEAARRLLDNSPVPTYISLALDATYFAHNDPPRGVVMACAAWENALRYYLANVASKRDPAYEVASKIRGIERLYEFACVSRGGQLFFDIMTDSTSRTMPIHEWNRKLVRELPKLRNQLLHEGVAAMAENAAMDSALAVLNAIEWLFD
jgi:hypothetical protein